MQIRLQRRAVSLAALGGSICVDHQAVMSVKLFAVMKSLSNELRDFILSDVLDEGDLWRHEEVIECLTV